MSKAVDLIKRTIRAVRIAATDSRIPRPLRWLAALGLAPIPGPFVEALLLIVAVPLALFYRRPLRDADVDEVYARVVAAGFEGEKEPWDAFWGQRYALLGDPDGVRVNLYAALSS